jgi:2-oxo-4-hydroxy-4-carboxy-5-ureidoimidazoline decarboxylase
MHALKTLAELNELPREDFVASLGDVFEKAAWIAEAALAARPFATVAALHDTMMHVVRDASTERQLAFLRDHPELGTRRAGADPMTEASKAEQGSLGLDRLSDPEFARFAQLNAAYRQRFGFPFIICVRRHTRDSIFAQFERRTHNGADAELAAALEEIGFITRLRLVAKIEGPGKPKTTGRLSTHALDITCGRPAAGVEIALYEIGTSAHGLLVKARTNADGRTDSPLIADQPLRIGTYELEFKVGDYFAGSGSARSNPSFLDVVPVRFSIAEPEGHYHVPLLVTPWSYIAYRGS